MAAPTSIPGLTPRDVQLAAATMLRELADTIERREVDIRAMHFDQQPPDADEGEYTMTLRCGPCRPLGQQTLTVALTTQD